MQLFNIECIECKNIAKQVRQFSFKHLDEKSFDYIPGQFITLHLNHEGKELKRSYSLSRAPKADSNIIEFATSYVPNGRASDFLFKIKAGVRLQCSGPYGRLVLPEENPERFILIATGTGVTPYRAMINKIKEKLEESDLKIQIVFGTRTKEDILYEQEFLNLQKIFKAFNYTVYLSQTKENLAAHQFSGYVQNHFSTLALNPEKDIVFLCGNPQMIDDAFSELKEYGFDNRRVKREKYISK